MRAYLVLLLAVLFIFLCGCSVRAGYGPYDTANYMDLDARSEIMEGKAFFSVEETEWARTERAVAYETATQEYILFMSEIEFEKDMWDLYATEHAWQEGSAF